MSSFRLEADDHLERRMDSVDWYEGLKMAQRAARALNFMAVTGLRAPSANEMAGPSLVLSEYADHRSHWYDDESKCIVILDEPYPHLLQDEIDWAEEHGFHTVGVRWRGVYSASNTPRLHSVSKTLISRLAKKLKALETRLKVEEWTHETQPYESSFISPARTLSGKRKLPRMMPAPEGVERAGAVPCGPGEPGYRSRWRPARRMDLDKHLQIGPILERLTLSTGLGLESGLTRIRLTLNKWFEEEYKDADLPDKQMRQDYYSPAPTAIKGAADALAELAVVRQIVVVGYQDCKPKRDLLDRIGRCEQQVQRSDSRRNP
ncbi:hypothetical protein C206_28976 [Pseudomonas putida TRO1]|uniref:DUF5623 domain-containing protein n=6 Tax=Pseudomonas TaxID=286 RepID=A0A2S3WKG8_PSEPU|nr:hypothetical protein L483_15480 [Pseudomonas putida H8234]ENY74098.1 hypothetical protein C206_28976 [Pseudomonas putida TRO1]MBA1319810.1 DUF5623 domain-containing protein [Pseudomonas monteilii]PKF23109.1 hypothetical protein CW309_29015 [Pseudomonas hunanensis]PMY80033.1 hypothetical protein C1X72_17025 [Pseudomonas sp. FW306-2-2C-D06B]POF99697.1 hypothetical protein BGP82_28050 [Pseudomonas putida]